MCVDVLSGLCSLVVLLLLRGRRGRFGTEEDTARPLLCEDQSEETLESCGHESQNPEPPEAGRGEEQVLLPHPPAAGLAVTLTLNFQPPGL